MVQFLRLFDKFPFMKNLIISLLIMLSVSAINAQVKKGDILQDLEKNQPSIQNATQSATLKSASRLFGEKDDLTTVIMIIPSGSVVDVLDADSTYLHIIFEENEGYIFKRQAVLNNKPVAPVSQEQESVQSTETQSRQQQQRKVSRFTYLENKYGSNMAAKLIAGKIWKGMTAEMVSDSWGTPQKINRVISSNVIKEEWIYNNTWLYIENDELVQWGPIKK